MSILLLESEVTRQRRSIILIYKLFTRDNVKLFKCETVLSETDARSIAVQTFAQSRWPSPKPSPPLSRLISPLMSELRPSNSTKSYTYRADEDSDDDVIERDKEEGSEYTGGSDYGKDKWECLTLLVFWIIFFYSWITCGNNSSIFKLHIVPLSRALLNSPDNASATFITTILSLFTRFGCWSYRCSCPRARMWVHVKLLCLTKPVRPRLKMTHVVGKSKSPTFGWLRALKWIAKCFG